LMRMLQARAAPAARRDSPQTTHLVACAQFSCRAYAGCMQGVVKTAKPPAIKPTALPFSHKDRLPGRHRWGCRAGNGREISPNLASPMRRRKGRRLPSDRKSIGPAQSASSGFFAAAELTGDQLAYGCGAVPSVSVPELGLVAIWPLIA